MSLFLRLWQEWRRTNAGGKGTLYDIFLRNRAQDLHKWHHYFSVYEQLASMSNRHAPRANATASPIPRICQRPAIPAPTCS